MKGFLSKCVDLLQDHQIYCFQACMCALFSPEIVQAGAEKGLNLESNREKKSMKYSSLFLPLNFKK